MSSDDLKLQIDDDWKNAAAAEKEKLAAEVEGKDRQSTPRDIGPLPDPSFIEIIQILAMQAMVGLGGMQGPGGQAIPPNLEIAKHHIDLLAVLEQKTQGKLESQEQQILNTTLYQLRIAYVEAMQGGPGAPGARRS